MTINSMTSDDFAAISAGLHHKSALIVIEAAR